ncbi:MAG TPA: hypothetical protein VMD07_10470 [Candidatus Acidoferrales bacterium]|nr:hypothetical protein [Candidatus Acidoferrales bacterium]
MAPKQCGLVLSALVVAPALLSPAQGAAPDPYTIFANARAYWLVQHYPMLLDYRVAVEVTEGGHVRVEHYSAEYNAVTGEIGVDPVSDYQIAHPVVPKGINVGLLGLALNKPLPPIDFMGVPHLAPTYSFGMAPFVPAPTPTPFNSAALVAEIRKEFHDPNPRATPTPSPTPNGLQEIATVYANNRDYMITLLGVETIEGHACYHLSLTPTHDPGRFRIRQAWIDEQTFAPWQLEDASNFTDGPGTKVAWMIHFADIDAAHYVSEEDALAPMSTGGEIYTKAAVRFEDVRAVDASTMSAPITAGGTLLQEPPS